LYLHREKKRKEKNKIKEKLGRKNEKAERRLMESESE
jgi:hypothetical protein